jgi:hypothetical protein
MNGRFHLVLNLINATIIEKSSILLHDVNDELAL